MEKQAFCRMVLTYLKANRAELNFNLDEVMSEVHNHGKIPVAEPVVQNISCIIMNMQVADVPDQEQW